MVVRNQLRLIVRQAVETFQVGGDAAVQAVGDALALVGLAQEFFVVGIADKGDFGEHRGHVGADQDNERGLFHAAVALVLIDQLQAVGQRILDVVGQFLRFFHFFVAGDFLDDVLQVVQRFLGQSVFAGGDFHGFGGGREIQIVGFDAARGLVVAGIGVHRDEQVGFGVVGDGGA